jgi:mono/diheme cytochrome c family protein
MTTPPLLVPTLCVGTPAGDALRRGQMVGEAAQPTPWPGRRASSPAYPRRAWAPGGEGWWRWGLAMLICLLTTACQQEMARQPNYRPLEPTTFFADGRASRPLVAGTVARGQPLDRSPLVTFRTGSRFSDVGRAAALVGNPTMVALGTLLPFTVGAGAGEYVDVFPFPMDRQALERGQQRFNIFCAVCHDALGTGNGKIVERGYLKPTNYHTEYSRGFERRGLKVLLRDAPLGYYFEVISLGYGAMPDYASQISVEDRWKIIAYIRALQLSQWAPLEDLPEAEREKVRARLPGQEERP